jgi:hypothetical protein
MSREKRESFQIVSGSSLLMERRQEQERDVAQNIQISGVDRAAFRSRQSHPLPNLPLEGRDYCFFELPPNFLRAGLTS